MSDNKEALPIVVLCGRPNVGKSTLFNRLIKSNRAITHDMPGVTRDRMEGIVRRKGLKPFEIVDTGGITLDAAANVADGPQGIRGFEAEILAQADEALSRAAAVAFVVDGKDGLLPLDEHLAAHIRRKNMPVLCVVNKVDGLEREDEQMAEFHALGFPLLAVSAEHGYQINALCEDLAAMLPEGGKEWEELEKKPGLRLCMLGRPNAGKSSFLNELLGEEKAIVTDIAGTTRDVLEENIRLGGLSLHIIDTAGIRKTDDTIEKIGVEKARKYALEADLIIYIVDSSVDFDESDEDILEILKDKHFIVLLNKSDLNMAVTEQEIKERLCDFSDYEVIKISALQHQGMEDFEEAVKRMFFKGEITFNNEVVITSMRHKEALMEAEESISMVKQSIKAGMSEDFYSVDLMDAYAALGRIIGEEVGDDLVNEIFEKFCMGK